MWLQTAKNGVDITGTTAVILEDTDSIEVVGLNVALAKFDEILLVLENGSFDPPITMALLVEDGVSSGGGGETTVHSAPRNSSAENDEFNSDTLDAKWTQTSSGTAPAISRDTIVRSNYFAKFGAAAGTVELTQNSRRSSADICCSRREILR